MNLDQNEFRPNPKQCFKCFAYGHVRYYCPNKGCFICLEEHEVFDICLLPKYCIHCRDSHFPNAKERPSQKLEQKIVEVSGYKHISTGCAKH